jgi:hypothetical protein
VAAWGSCAVDDTAHPSADNKPQIIMVRVKPVDAATPKLRFQLSDGSIDLMKA